jgi:hypothetical protein
VARVQLFLSAVSAEFLSYRKRLRHSLTRPNVEVKVQEDFIVTGNETLEMLDTYIQCCDGVIHLVGDMTGAMAKPQSAASIALRYPKLASHYPQIAEFLQPQGFSLSYTQWEAWLALWHRKNLFIATPQRDAPRDEKCQWDPAQQALQQDHLNRLRSAGRHSATAFRGEDHLGMEVHRSFVQDLMVRAELDTIDRRLSYPAGPSTAAQDFKMGNVVPFTRDNPFGDRGCIRDPKRFFDRQDILQHIFAELRKGSSLSLVGESQIGKSSILEMIKHWGPQELNKPLQYFISIGMENIQNENDFFEALCDKLGFSQTLRGYRLKRAIGENQWVVCIDEIEKMTDRKCFSGAERSELRGLADGADAPLSLVIASRTDLHTLFNDDPRKTSPLASVCQMLRVGTFSLTTSKDFLLDRLKGNSIQFSLEESERLYHQTKGHPARLQAAAADLYRERTGIC